MKPHNLETEAQASGWVKPLNQENKLSSGQLSRLNYKNGRLQLFTNEKCISIEAEAALFDQVALHFFRGYSAIAIVDRVSPDDKYYLDVMFVLEQPINIGPLHIALDKHTLKQLDKKNPKQNFQQHCEHISQSLLFQTDANSDEHYAFAYLSQAAYDELKQIETAEKIELNSHQALSSHNNIVMVGENLQLAIREYKNGKGSYLGAKKLSTSPVRHLNKAIRLLKLQLQFSEMDNPELLSAYAAKQMQQLTNNDNSYLATWDKYGQEEGEQLLIKARKIGTIELENIELCNNGKHLEVFPKQFPENCKKLLKNNDYLEAVLSDPDYLSDEDIDWTQYSQQQFERYKQKNGLQSGLQWNIEEKKQQKNDKKKKDNDKNFNNEDIDDAEKTDQHVSNEIVKVIKVTQHSIIIDAKEIPKNAKLIYSILGDKIQVERRMTARESISHGSCAMPMLGAIIEEEGQLPERRRPYTIEPLTDHVKNKIFPDHPQTPTQEDAIKIALNTPDIAIIQGPPGTGKTTVITAIIERLNEIFDKQEGVEGQILVSGYQHDAVENILSRLSVNSLPSVKFGKRSSENEIQTTTDEKIEFWRNKIVGNVKKSTPELEFSRGYYRILNSLSNYKESPNNGKALRILQLCSEAIDHTSNVKLSKTIKYLIENIQSILRPSDQNQLKIIRSLRVSYTGFNDDGTERALELRDAFKQDLTHEEQDALNTAIEWQEAEPVDFLLILKQIKRKLLLCYRDQTQLLDAAARTDVIQAVEDCIQYMESSDYLRDPTLKVLSTFIDHMENNPAAIKSAVSEYNTVYGATTGQAEGKDIRRAKVGQIGKVNYDTIIVDEAARAAPRDLMIPMAQAKNRIILVGDHRQLPHMIEDSIVEALQDDENASENTDQHIRKSMFEYLKARLKKLEQQDGLPRTITLDAQYRSHPLLGDFASKAFYEPHGEAYISGLPAEKFQHSLPGIEQQAAVWIDVPNQSKADSEEKNKLGSTFRKSEAASIASHINFWINSEQGKNLSFGIITFYKAQVDELFQALEKYKITEKDDNGNYYISENYRMLYDDNKKPIEERLRIGTVDSFQGMEFDVVLLSVVRSSKIGKIKNKENRNVFGHLMSKNRLCVSMTRQKKSLIVVGDQEFITSPRAIDAIPELNDFYKLCKSDGKLLKHDQIKVKGA